MDWFRDNVVKITIIGLEVQVEQEFGEEAEEQKLYTDNEE